MVARLPLLTAVLAALSIGGCDATETVDAGIDSGLSDGAADAGSAADAEAPLDGASGPCVTHHDCAQGSFCHRGECRVAQPPVFHCNRPGCPPGQWCVEADGTRSVCVEDDAYPCASACDCGPAHCCLAGRCVRDEGDPWVGTSGVASACPVGPGVSAPSRVPTYCAADPACFVASHAWQLSGRAGTFLAHDPVTGAATSSCGGERCFGTACNCDLGESCVDTVADAAPGSTCDLFAGGTCIGNALAESVFGFGAAALLGCCADGCLAGERCDAGWMRRGNRRAYERVVAECAPPGGCTCGDGTCCPEELRSCPSDCMPERCSGGACAPIACGDGRCDPFEDDVRCPGDCPAGCGDGHCDGAETEATCFTDCQEECGDGWCGASELTDEGSCNEDCDARCDDAGIYSRVYRVCGDGVCDRTSTCDTQEPESCLSCPRDCGACDWEIVEVAPERPVRGRLDSVWVNGANDVFVSSREGHVFHFDGDGWTLGTRLSPQRLALWSPGPDVAFTVGSEQSSRYDGRGWAPIVAPADLTAAWGTGARDVFAVSRDALHHYDGHRWTSWARPPASDSLRDVFGIASDDLYVANASETILHFDGSSFTERFTVAGESVSAVWASAPDDVYGVGTTYDVPGGPGRPPDFRATVVHFDGTSWSDIHPDGALGMIDVWGAAPDDVFALDSEGTLWRTDGVGWTSFPPSAPFNAESLHGSSATEVYAVGADAVGTAVIHRFDGSRWAVVPVTAPLGSWQDVWGESADALRLAVDDRIATFDGVSFTYETLSPPIEATMTLTSIWGSSPDNLFAVAELRASPLGGGPLLISGAVWHLQAGAWSGIVASPSPRAVWGSGPNDVYLTGWRETARYDGSAWTPLVGLSGRYAVWASGPNDVYIVGTNSVLHCDAGPCDDPLAFTETVVAGALRGISGTGPTDVLAVGLGGVILHGDGTAWSEQRRGGVDLEDVAVRGPTEAYAVGDRGEILFYDGATWAPAQADLRRPGAPRCPPLNAITNAGGTLVSVGEEDIVVRQRP